MNPQDREANEPDARSLESAAREFALQFPDCPEPAQLQAALAGVLPEELRDRVNLHVAQCPACTSLTKDLFTLDDAPLEAGGQARIWGRIRSGIAAEEFHPRAAASRSPWWRSMLRPMPLAAVAAAAILVAFGVRSLQNLRQPAAATNQAREAAGAGPPPAALHLDKPPVMLPAAAVLVWRGSSDAAAEARKQLQDALAPYEADQYAEAAQRLEAVSKAYPSLAEAQFYLGVCRLFMGRNGDAASALEKADSLAIPALAADAEWYLALAYHGSGRDSDARRLLEKLCRANGKNSARACSGMIELPAKQ